MEFKMMEFKTYKKHYEESIRKSKIVENHDFEKDGYPLHNLGIDFASFERCQEYEDLVKKIAIQIDERISRGKEERTNDILDAEFVTYLDNWRDINEIHKLANLVIPQIEKKISKCKLKVEFVLPYENKKTEQVLKSSWLWHYDNCPKEFIKLAIYLNDVTEKNGCFQYLEKDGSAQMMHVTRLNVNPDRDPPVPNTRMDNKFISNFISEGGKIVNVTGSLGTNFLFNPNVLHRATKPEPNTNSRQAIFFFLRPTVDQECDYIDEKTCSIRGNQRRVKKYKAD